MGLLAKVLGPQGAPADDWSIVYEPAVRKDGSLFFPERLTPEFLDEARKIMGSYLFANQYQNEIIPDEEKVFRVEWLRYYKQVPTNVYRFAFIDPAIGQKKTSDFTGITKISVDSEGTWYLTTARRARLKPTEIVNLVFDPMLADCQAIGIESVAYQEALLYLIDEEGRRRQQVARVTGVKPPTTKTKEMRILGLVPRFEWGRILIAQGLHDFETEYSQFPRGVHDDIMDALAQLEEIVFYPKKEIPTLVKPNSPTDPGYEKWYIQDLARRANGGGDGDGSE